MNAKRGYYSLIQFCPDPSRAERVNVGVVLFCPEAEFIAARTAHGNRQAEKLVAREALDRAGLNAAKRAIERRLEVERESFKTLDDLQRFVDTRANVLKLTASRPIKVFDAEQDLDRLYNELVGGRPRRRLPPPVFPKLDDVFRRLERQGRARLDWTVRIPLLERGLRIPYAYRNGVWSLVKPRVFSSDKAPALESALRLAEAGYLLQRRGEDEEGKKQLIVVPTFERGAEVENVEKGVTELLHEYNVTSVPLGKVDEFAAQVEQEAHAETG